MSSMVDDFAPEGRTLTGRLRGRDGFTLVEALAAFAILALLTVVVQRVFVSAKTSSVRADERIGAEWVARTLLTQPLGPERAPSGSQSGVLDGYRWTMTLEPLDLPGPALEAQTPRAGPSQSNPGAPPSRAASSNPEKAAPDPARWRPHRVTIQVGEAPGRRLEVETVRLVAVD